jgi:20S proteasome alpha/beta subunit
VRQNVPFLIVVLAFQSGLLTASLPAQEATTSFLRDLTPRQLESSYIHGTIDVVISTRDGFVLATDSRATYNQGESHSDDAQKLFPIGKTSACVIAGLIGSDMHLEGFRLRDAMGTHLVQLDHDASARNRPMWASDIAQSFSQGLGGVAGLLIPVPQPQPGLVGAVSAVSVSPDGEPDWITLVLPLAVAHGNSPNSDYYTVGKPEYLHHSLNIGLRFGIEAIGQPALVNLLLTASQPSPGIKFSNSVVMKKFYERKQQGHLDEYRLEEAVDLARALVAATIAALPPEAGVGGPIDVMTVTKGGIHWIQKKEHSAPFPPPFGVRFFGGTFGPGGMPLDGLECIRCTFLETKFSYAGDGDVELLSPAIDGHCQLTLSPDARRKMPQVVDRLKRALADKCEIIEQPAG